VVRRVAPKKFPADPDRMEIAAEIPVCKACAGNLEAGASMSAVAKANQRRADSVKVNPAEAKRIILGKPSSSDHTTTQANRS